MRLPFTKMHGIGNDYVYVDAFAVKLSDPAEVARRVSPRRTGIGSDGLILIGPSATADLRMEMYNADGSRGEMCGNGIRCVGKLAYERGIVRRPQMRVETDAGIRTLRLEIEDERVRRVEVDMGRPDLSPASLPVLAEGPLVDAPLTLGGEQVRATCVSMGNPHCVLFVASTERAPVGTLGPRIERDPLFPRGVNVEFVEVLEPPPAGRLRMRVWERGSGETAACGTGACAALVAAHLTGRAARQASVELLGGTLEVAWHEADDSVSLKGEATEVFTGEIEL